VAGCGGPGDAPAGPGRFAHSAIHKTIAPWDGPATQLYLAENPMAEHRPAAPCLSVRIYKLVTDLSKQRLRLEEKESRLGGVQWLKKEGQTAPVQWVEVEFDAIQEGQPVTGTYEVAFPDGTRQRGQFKAAWWRGESMGG
jgi:hypothetical protein